MRYIFLFLLIGTLQAQNLHQVNVPTAIGGSPHPSSLLTLNSTSQGFLIPRMTTSQRTNIPTPATGLMVYDTDLNQIQVFNGTWGSLGGATPSGSNGAIQFNNNGAFGSDVRLAWDDANNRLALDGNGLELFSWQTRLRQNELVLYSAASLKGSASGHFWTTSGNFSIGTDVVTQSRLNVRGSGTANGTDALLVEASDGTDLFEVENGGLISVGKNVGGSGTQSTATIQVKSGDTNTGLALVPKGEGSITVNIPDGTTAGGNARGISSVDLQLHRDGANKVASGTRAVISGGSGNRASSSHSFVGGGLNNLVDGSGYNVIAGGQTNSISHGWSNAIGGGRVNIITAGDNATISGGNTNTASSSFSSITGGFFTRTTLYGQRAQASGQFATSGTVCDNQTSDIRFRALVTGTSTDTLFLDGVSQVAQLSLTGTTNARVWNARIQCVAIVTAQGDGTVAAGLTHSETYDIVIKRTSAGTVIVGSNPIGVIRVSEMSTASFTVDADTTNNALRIRFTPPSGAGSTTTIRAAATAYLTELGY